MAYNKKNWEINKNKLLEIQKQKKGGDKEESSKRTFKIVELNGNVVDFGHLTIKRKTSGGNPGPGTVVEARKFFFELLSTSSMVLLPCSSSILLCLSSVNVLDHHV